MLRYDMLLRRLTSLESVLENLKSEGYNEMSLEVQTIQAKIDMLKWVLEIDNDE